MVMRVRIIINSSSLEKVVLEVIVGKEGTYQLTGEARMVCYQGGKSME